MIGNIIIGVMILVATIYLVRVVIKAIKLSNSSCCGCKGGGCKNKK